jgi:tRNA nucleotidyltransferase (CCA-adding enzyme)
MARDNPGIDGEGVLERVRELPGGAELLDLAGGRADVELVGGAVRDLLLGRTPRELDVIVLEDPLSLARELGSSLGVSRHSDPQGRSGIALHERFGTALLWWESGRIDIARRRAESYPAPGALPEVRAGTPEEDLSRRDFTVNAIAVALGGPRRGTLSAAPHALADLSEGRLRVLHERSFLDDPTRLLRLARYRVRLGFEAEQGTAELAAEALAGGALQSVSGARIGMELRLALAEPDPLDALRALGELGVLSSLQPQLAISEQPARTGLAILPGDGRADVLLLGALLLSITQDPGEAGERTMFDLLDALEFTAGDRDRAIQTALAAPALVKALQQATTPSQLRAAARPATLEAVALAASLAEQEGLTEAGARARRWLSELRHVGLRISGDDLLAAGVPAGPEIGERLELTLRRKLDGELVEDREAELNAATEGL